MDGSAVSRTEVVVDMGSALGNKVYGSVYFPEFSVKI
jgi:hypothetical protein